MITGRAYFFTPTINSERFLSQDEPTEQVMRNFLDSIPFKTEAVDTATETQQGLVETATQLEFDNGIDNNANGFALYVRPSMIKISIQAAVTLLQNQINSIVIDNSVIQNDITVLQTEVTNITNIVTTGFQEQMPIGSMLMYPIAVPPNVKWELCEGQTLSVAAYPELFALIGYNFGGLGASFNLPDLRSKFLAGYNSAGPSEYQTIGQGAGANDVTLTGTQSGMPNHNHSGATGANGSHSHTFDINKRVKNAGGTNIYSLVNEEKSNNDGTQVYPGFEGTTMSDPGNHTHTIPGSGSVNAVDAHENRPEFIVFPWIIKLLN
jgi:microcystin-dependent protein